jgi:CRISPR-associated endonuclease/helicase Cas3
MEKTTITESRLAHSCGHFLAYHLNAVAELACEFAQVLGSVSASPDWAYLAGLWHDLGKYRPGFQRYLMQSDKPNRNGHVQ